jgi:hypothetical protein
MNLDQTIIEFIDKLLSMDRKKINVIKRPLENIPSWEAFIEHKNNAIEKSAFRTMGSKSLYLAFNVDRDDEQLYKNFNGLGNYVECLNKALGKEWFHSGPAFINSESLESSSGVARHHDKGEVIHWNCVGTSHWKIWPYYSEQDSHEDEHFNITLEEGDVLFMPRSYWHEVKSSTACRAGIIYFGN